MDVRWLVSTSAAAIYSGEAALTSQATSSPAAVKAAAEQLNSGFLAAGLPADRGWREMAALAAGIENNRQLATLVWKKLIGGEPSSLETERIAGRIADLEAAAKQHAPDLLNELELRSGPIRSQWEARGPGMLNFVSSRISDQLIAPRADVLMVPPVHSGGGWAAMPYNVVAFEAVLANPREELPEAIRLAWLLLQLNMDLPIISEPLHRDRLARVAPLAAIPLAVHAGQFVELVPETGPALLLAVESWTDEPQAARTAATLDDWWQTLVSGSQSFSTALLALDRMLVA